MTGHFDLHIEHTAFIEHLQFDTLPISFALIAVIRPMGDLLQSSSNRLRSCIVKIKQGFTAKVSFFSLPLFLALSLKCYKMKMTSIKTLQTGSFSVAFS